MEQVKVRFLEPRVVDNVHVGTALETRFEAGEVYELDARSADRWVKRGAAVFLSQEDERKASGASRNVALDMLDPKRKDAEKPAGQSPSEPTASTGHSDAQRGLADEIIAELLSVRAGTSVAAWRTLPAEAQITDMRAALDEIRDGFAGRRDPFDHDGDGRPGGSLPVGREPLRSGPPLPGPLPVGNGGSDTDGDQTLDVVRADQPRTDTDADRLGDSPMLRQTGDGAGPGVSTSTLDAPAGQAVTLEDMTDDQLRDFVEKRDGTRPRRNVSRETLIERARAPAQA